MRRQSSTRSPKVAGRSQDFGPPRGHSPAGPTQVLDDPREPAAAVRDRRRPEPAPATVCVLTAAAVISYAAPNVQAPRTG